MATSACPCAGRTAAEVQSSHVIISPILAVGTSSGTTYLVSMTSLQVSSIPAALPSAQCFPVGSSKPAALPTVDDIPAGRRLEWRPLPASVTLNLVQPAHHKDSMAGRLCVLSAKLLVITSWIPSQAAQESLPPDSVHCRPCYFPCLLQKWLPCNTSHTACTDLPAPA